MATERANPLVPGLTVEEQNLLTGRALTQKLSVLQYRHWEVLAARCALAIAATVVLMLSAFMVWRANRILTTYDQEMMYRRISTSWLIRHGTQDRRQNSGL